MKVWRLAAALVLAAVVSGCGAKPETAEPAWKGSMDMAVLGAAGAAAVPAETVSDTEALLCWQDEAGRVSAGVRVYEDGHALPVTEEKETAGGRRISDFLARHPEGGGYTGTAHAVMVMGLTPGQRHRLTVRPVTEEGKVLSPLAVVEVETKPERQDLSITDFGAASGDADNAAAIQQAIDACPPGGRVRVPAGVYRMGAIRLHSDMDFHLEKGAVLLGSERAEAYPLDAVGRPAPLISAEGGHDVSITGAGTIDGSGWQTDASGAAQKADNQEGSPHHVLYIGKLAATETARALAAGMTFKQAYQQRSTLISLDRTDRVFLEGITVKNPAMHGLNLSSVHQAALYNVSVETYNANNGDGIDFRGKGLLIADSYFDTGDDAINFNAGVGRAAMQGPSTSDAWLFQNFIGRAHGGVVLGSHTAAWIERILAEDMVMDGTDIGLRAKTGRGVGGGARDVLFRRSALAHIQKDAFSFVSSYTDSSLSGADSTVPSGVFSRIAVEDCTVDGTGGGSVRAEGEADSPFTDFSFRRIQFRSSRDPVFSYTEGVVWKDIEIR